MKEIIYSDNQLVEMIKKGGVFREKAFEFLLDQENRIKKIGYSLRAKGASPQDSMEIIDDAMIALNTSIARGRFKKDASIQAYLTGAARNMWNKRWKKENKQGKKMEIEAYTFEDPGQTAEDVVIQRERRQLLISFLGRLSQACRKILTLAYFEEKSNDELVGLLGYKDKLVVSSKKSKCLRQLVAILKANAEIFNCEYGLF